MGGCCCSSSRTASGGAPVYYHFPQDLEERGPFSATHDAPSAVPVLVDPNQDTSIPDAYQQPNAVLPLMDFIDAQTNARSTENYSSKNEHRQSTYSVPVGDAVGGNRFEPSERCGGFIGLEIKSVADLVSSPKVKQELSHMDSSTTLVIDDDDVCPTCLEEYDAENPRIITKCKHHFHLSCILEWFERSNNCAVCDQLMEIEDMALFDRTL